MNDIKEYLDEAVDLYNRKAYLDHDPLAIPHTFSKKEDQEISAYFAATIAWGNRVSIVKDAWRIMDIMDRAPYEFVMNASKSDFPKDIKSLHRTFMMEDFEFLVKSLRRVYQKKGGMEGVFTEGFKKGGSATAIALFRKEMLAGKEHRASKHLADPLANSTAKRMNMLLRWLVRRDDRKVDLGIWKEIPMSKLSIPLDVHAGRMGRELGILKRTANDWKAVCELDEVLRSFDAVDPVKYDYALFGISEARNKKRPEGL
jgi:uncharacterized protein (TIGR02757 family)